MKFTRKLLAIIIVLSMVLALAPTTASAAGFQGLTEADAWKAQSDYLKSLESGSSSADNTHATGKVVDGIQIPPDVAAMKSFKDGSVRVIVTIPGETISTYAVKHSSSLATMTPYLAAPAIAKIAADQDASVQAVQAQGVILTGVQRFSVLFNGYSAQIAVADLGKLADAVGRANIHFSHLARLEDTASNALIGATALHLESPGLDGSGAFVGVIDTGVDYTHPNLGGAPSSTFPTEKIVAGWDFAGDNAGAIDDRNLIHPDPDPMDTAGHGTHVSGIIAADGAVMGVAPKARIVIAKVFPGDSGQCWSEEIISAFEYMADPGNLDDGPEGAHPVVQSINMSVGAFAGFDDPTDPERVAIDSAIASGIVVALSAGNSASNYSGIYSGGAVNYTPDYSTVGSPAVTPGAISVASSQNSAIEGVGVTETTAAADYLYYIGSTSPDPVVSLGDNAGAGYAYVYCGIGQASNFTGLELTGKIALIDRGTINFATKINNAAALGAVGVIIANNLSGFGPASMDTTGATLTSLSVSKADGLTLKAKAAAPTGNGTGVLKFLGHHTSMAVGAVDTISSFSSWGASPNLTFKPEVTAPGGDILSTVPVAQGSYDYYSGTSMAAPHVAGAAALIKLAHPTWPVEQVKTVLMNTAALLTDPESPTGLPYSPRVQGAGRINVFDALHTSVTATSQINGQAAVALGSVESWMYDPITFPVVLHNSGATDMTYAIGGTIQWVNNSWYGSGYGSYSVSIPGAVFSTIPAGTVTVPAAGTRTVTVTVDARAVDLSYYYTPYVEGFVTFTPASGVALHVPYMGYLGNWNDFDSSTWAPTFNPLMDLPLRIDSFTAQLLNPATDYGKTGLTWPGDPTNGGNLMGKTFTGVFNASTIAINPDRVADGPSGGIQNNIHLLRNVENLKVEVRNTSGILQKLIADEYRLRKINIASDGFAYYAWEWYGDNVSGSSTLPDGHYFLNTVATAEKVVNKASFDAPQTVSFPVCIDTVNPSAAVTSVEAGDPGKRKVNFTGSDAGSGLWGYAVFHGVDGTDPGTWAYTMVAPAASTSCQIPEGDAFFVVAYDNAKNVTTALQIVTESLPDAMVDQPYATVISTTGGTGSYVYTVSAGALPDGLALSAGGTISGTPTIADTYTFTVQVADGVSIATKTYTMNVYRSGLSITTPSLLPVGVLGIPYYQVLSAVGGDGVNYSWSLNSGTLPPGLSITYLTPVITSTTASLHGTPTAAGTYNFTLKVVSPIAGDMQATFKDFTLTILPVDIGIFRPSTNGFYLRSSTGVVAAPIFLGDAGDLPIVGDWDGNGTNDLGIFRPSTNGFYLRSSTGVVAAPVYLGDTGDLPIVGDWDGNGTDEIGIYRPSNAAFYLRSSTGVVAAPIFLGDSGDLPIVGDWTRDGTDEIGVFRPSTNVFHLRSSTGVVAAPIFLGDTGDLPITGIWQ